MMATDIPFYSTVGGAGNPVPMDRFPAVTERSRLKALDHSNSSDDAEGFMRHYDATLKLLHQGVDVVNAPRVFLTAAQQAGEVEALAAYRIHESCWHRQPCRCPECTQRRVERSTKEKVEK